MVKNVAAIVSVVVAIPLGAGVTVCDVYTVVKTVVVIVEAAGGVTV